MARNGSARSLPDFAAEQRLRYDGFRLIAGVDEAGRGPIAGPVVAAAVVLDPATCPDGLDDSKRLSAERRNELAIAIRACAAVGIGIIGPREIDDVNILQATMQAMQRAVADLRSAPDAALIDGNRAPALACETRTLVKGDQRSLSIAAASIIAKVTRDDLMDAIARDHPGYGFETHRGYPTLAHRRALVALGPCPEHRRSFRPVAEALAATAAATSAP